MAHVLITQFAGIMPEVNARLKSAVNAQIAHNCLLTDGSLRPQAKWIDLRVWESQYNDQLSIVYDGSSDNVYTYDRLDVLHTPGEPFAGGLAIGADPFWTNNSGITINEVTCSRIGAERSGGAGIWMAGVPNTIYGGITFTRSYDSVKPVNRVYAATSLRQLDGRIEESTPRLVTSQNATDILYEGDLVQITLYSFQQHVSRLNGVRIYRSISGLDTGENVTNELDTEWHLVAQMNFSGIDNELVYIDGESATASPLDVCYSQNFHVPKLLPEFFGLAESGWYVAGSRTGDIQISERYLHHAWPVDNHIRIQNETLTDMVVHSDNVYVGTESRPYIVSLSAGESALQLAARPFPEILPCLPGSMAAAAGGAIYASTQGVVALSREGQQIISRDIANPGDVLFRKTYSRWELSNSMGILEVEDTLEVTIDSTTFGAYFQGRYYGFIGTRLPISQGGGY